MKLKDLLVLKENSDSGIFAIDVSHISTHEPLFVISSDVWNAAMSSRVKKFNNRESAFKYEQSKNAARKSNKLRDLIWTVEIKNGNVKLISSNPNIIDKTITK